MLIWMVGAVAVAATVEVAVGEDWCGAINAAMPGDEVVLSAGSHDGPCTIWSDGTDTSPITLRGADPDDPSWIVYEGSSSNVIDVYASHLTIASLGFGPTQANIDAFKVKEADHLTISDCLFVEVGGISVGATSTGSAYQNITISGNTFTDLQATGIYLGCHSGESDCTAEGISITDNRFNGVTSSSVGYAIQIKLDSWGEVRDNVIADPQGPGIMIYGDTSGDESLVEGNLVSGSRANAAIEVGGGPAVVRNNIVESGATAGVYVYDYGGRDLLHGISVVANTVVGSDGPAFYLSGWDADEAMVFELNAAWNADGSDGIPAEVAGAGNVACTDASACWVDSAALNLWPAEGSLLAESGTATETLETDFCGHSRTSPTFAGALVDGGGGAFATDGFKSEFDCGAVGDTGGPVTSDTGASDTASGSQPGASDSGTSVSEKRSCGCVAAPKRDVGWLLGCALAVLQWRRFRLLGAARRSGHQSRPTARGRV